jgi:hypothetical protein
MCRRGLRHPCLGAGPEVGIGGIGSHGDGVPGVRATVVAVPARPLCVADCRVRDRSASDASRSPGSRIRHTCERRCDHGRSLQRCANMPPRALTGAS